jgi:hypothetical protein
MIVNIGFNMISSIFLNGIYCYKLILIKKINSLFFNFGFLKIKNQLNYLKFL